MNHITEEEVLSAYDSLNCAKNLEHTTDRKDDEAWVLTQKLKSLEDSLLALEITTRSNKRTALC